MAPAEGRHSTRTAWSSSTRGSWTGPPSMSGRSWRSAVCPTRSRWRGGSSRARSRSSPAMERGGSPSVPGSRRATRMRSPPIESERRGRRAAERRIPTGLARCSDATRSGRSRSTWRATWRPGRRPAGCRSSRPVGSGTRRSSVRAYTRTTRQAPCRRPGTASGSSRWWWPRPRPTSWAAGSIPRRRPNGRSRRSIGSMGGPGSSRSTGWVASGWHGTRRQWRSPFGRLGSVDYRAGP